jgi:hypothetical protein
MKKLLLAVAAFAMVVVFAETASAQASATQTLSLSVASIWRISTSGAVSMSIVTANPGSDSLASVTNSASTYSITHNNGAPARITAGLSPVMPTNTSLSVALASTKGTSSGTVDLSDGTTRNVVTAIGRGGDPGRTITYTFGATANANAFGPSSFTVTYTLTAP